MEFLKHKCAQFLSLFLLLLLSATGCKNQSEAPTTDNQVDAILVALTAEIDKDTTNAESFYNRARYYYENKGYDEAIQDLAFAMKRDSMQPKYFHLLSDVYMDYYQSRMALMALQKAVGFFPKDVPTLMKLAETQLILKLYHEGMQSIKTVLELDNQNADAYKLMGDFLKETGDYRRASLAYKRATELDGEYLEAWINIGVMKDELGEKDAMDYYKTALRLDSTSYPALYAVGMHYQNLNMRKEAIEAYKKINLLYPKLPEPYHNIAAMYIEQDSLDKALEFLDIAISVEMIYAEAYFAKGFIYEKKGELNEAWKNYSQAATLRPKFEKAHQAATRLEIQLNKKK